MATKNLNPIVHTFTEINKGKYRSVKHYKLQNVKNGSNQLSEIINIQKDRQFAKSLPDYWIKKRLEKKWSKAITGLFKTTITGVYYGDSNFKKHLLLVHFSEDSTIVNIFYYKDFYTKNHEGLALDVYRTMRTKTLRDV